VESEPAFESGKIEIVVDWKSDVEMSQLQNCTGELNY